MFPGSRFYLEHLCFGEMSLYFLFVLLVLVLAEVHYLRDWRNRIRRNFNEVKTSLRGLFKRFLAREHAEVALFRVNHAQLRGTYLAVDSCLVVAVISLKHSSRLKSVVRSFCRLKQTYLKIISFPVHFMQKIFLKFSAKDFKRDSYCWYGGGRTARTSRYSKSIAWL